MLTTESSFRWRLERLHIEHGVYFPLPVNGEEIHGSERCLLVDTVDASDAADAENAGDPRFKTSSFYKDAFLKMRQKRHLWKHDHDVDQHDHNIDTSCDTSCDASSPHSRFRHAPISKKKERQGESFNINVSVRFKPTHASIAQKQQRNIAVKKKTATLPLHQRLALIRIENNLECNRDALNILKQEGGWFKDKWTEIEREEHKEEEGDHGGDQGKKEQENNNKDQQQQRVEPTLLSVGVNSINCVTNSIVVVDPTKGLKNFQFDHVLADSTNQKDMYETAAKGLVTDFINGVNACCLVYGVTGSGKTYTMFGPDDDVNVNANVKNGSASLFYHTCNSFAGIVPRACQEIFQALSYREHNLNLEIKSSVAISYVEVYGNQILDLLQSNSSGSGSGSGSSICCPNQAASQGFVLNGETEIKVETVDDVMRALERGEGNKRKAATAMNDRSSRAHSILIVSLKQTCFQKNEVFSADEDVDEGADVSRTSQLFLADLGGCEQTKKSEICSGVSKHFEQMRKQQEEADSTTSNVVGDDVVGTAPAANNNAVSNNANDHDAATIKSRSRSETSFSAAPTDQTTATHGGDTPEYSTGFVKSERMREAVNINLGLMALKSCVNALASGYKYVPYADSKLTMMLSPALGGNSRTSVIVCAAQDEDLVPETIATLKFAQSCRRVQNSVVSDSDFLKKLIDNLDFQISKCEDEIKRKERWEVKHEVRQDLLAEEDTLESQGFGGKEVRKTTILVGAEEERKLLDHLLGKKAELTGTVIRRDFGGQSYGGSVGFGVAHKYGMGKKLQSGIGAVHENNGGNNYRFGEHTDYANIPESVKRAGGKGGWRVHGSGNGNNGDVDGIARVDDEGTRRLIRMRKKKSTLVYSGISA